MILRTALFHDVWTDIQTDQYLSSGLSYTANVGDGRNTGAWRSRPVLAARALTLEANALFNAPPEQGGSQLRLGGPERTARRAGRLGRQPWCGTSGPGRRHGAGADQPSWNMSASRA
jgi:hypothetical protein